MIPGTGKGRAGRWARAVCSTLVLLGAAGLPLVAQNPARSWLTIRTAHFYVHFTPELEEVARRAAADAESAYAKLSRYLSPPRGTIDLVVADNVDFSNGYATPFPSNRIVIYANPPVGDETLRFTDDPTELVVTHELTHIFHLDRSGGIWRSLRRVFGRDPMWFPNAFQPSWLVEGLAVYFESELTGSGRLAGTNHRMIARTAAARGRFPRIDELSLASPHFPYGYGAYAYGSLFVEYLAKTHGDSSLSRFVESSSRLLIPVWLNWPARRAFHTTFTTAYTHWRDSLQQGSAASAPSIAGWRDITTHGAYASVPRWLTDSTIIYDGTDGRSTYGAYQLTLREPPKDSLRSGVSRVSGLRSRVRGLRSAALDSVERERLAARDTRSPNTVLPNGSLMYSKLEYVSPYDLRSDLYIEFKGGRTRRITKGARLSQPDARTDGLVVAMQTVPAGAQLALVTTNGLRITPITAGGPDAQWTEPRWSPDGQHIAAVRWTRGGTSEIVVVDTTGRVEQTLIRERAVAADPSWSPDGRFVYFSSDRTGISNLYRSAFRPGAALDLATVEQVSDIPTGLFEPQLSPNGRQLLAVAYRADGYHLGLAQLDSLRSTPAEPIERVSPKEPAPVTSDRSPVTRYKPWRSLAPRYWQLFFEPALDSNAIRIGAFTSGRDVVDRHAYQALLYVPTDNSGITGAFAYRNARLGQPVFDLSGSQDRENLRCVADASQQNKCVGFLRRRIREASVAATIQRLRQRSFAYLSVGGGIELRDYSTQPQSLLGRIDSLYQHTLYWPRATVSLGWSNAQYPLLAVSPEDGMAFAMTTRMRWRGESPPIPVPAGPDTVDNSAYAFSAIASASLYKSIPLPGFAHHVVAVRAAGGWIDSRNPSYLEVGGVSGGTLEVLPGYNLGEGRRSFPVRGFPAAAMIGMRAFTITGEYRAPLALPGRGFGLWPAFLDRTSVTLFGDLGSAWCPGLYATRSLPNYSRCTQADFDIGRTTSLSSLPAIYAAAYNIGSVGGELTVSAAAYGWDHPFTFRLGFAQPVIGQNLLAGVSRATTYLTVGLSF